MASVRAETLSVKVPVDMMVDRNLCDEEAKTLFRYFSASWSRRAFEYCLKASTALKKGPISSRTGAGS